MLALALAFALAPNLALIVTLPLTLTLTLSLTLTFIQTSLDAPLCAARPACHARLYVALASSAADEWYLAELMAEWRSGMATERATIAADMPPGFPAERRGRQSVSRGH